MPHSGVIIIADGREKKVHPYLYPLSPRGEHSVLRGEEIKMGFGGHSPPRLSQKCFSIPFFPQSWGIFRFGDTPNPRQGSFPSTLF